jgi:hypothetical protein
MSSCTISIGSKPAVLLRRCAWKKKNELWLCSQLKKWFFYTTCYAYASLVFRWRLPFEIPFEVIPYNSKWLLLLYWASMCILYHLWISPAVFHCVRYKSKNSFLCFQKVLFDHIIVYSSKAIMNISNTRSQFSNTLSFLQSTPNVRKITYSLYMVHWSPTSVFFKI